MKVADAMAAGNIPALIPMLAMYTGDEKWLRPPYAPGRQKGLDDNHDGGLPPGDPGRDPRRRGGGRRGRRRYVCHAATHEQLVRMLSVAMGEEVPPEYGPMIAAELGLGGPPPAGARWTVPEGFRAIVIGAGVAGLADVDQARPGRRSRTSCSSATRHGRRHVAGEPLSGRRRGHAERPLLVLVRAARLDQYFALRDELHAYLEQRRRRASACASAIRFGHRGDGGGLRRGRPGVDGHVADPTARRDAAGQRPHQRRRAASTSPSVPDVAGLEHVRRARGPHRALARGPRPRRQAGRRDRQRRSAMQLVPAIAEEAAHVDRLPALAAVGGAVRAVPRSRCPSAMRWLMRDVPLYRALVPAAVWLDVQRQGPPGAAEGPRRGSTRSARSTRSTTATASSSPATSSPELGDRPDLMAKVLPDYPPFGKRMLLDNGWYADAAARRRRRWSPTPIGDVGRPVVTATGTEHEVDVLVLRDRLRRRALPGADRGPRARRRARCARCGTTTTRAPTSAPPCPASRTSSCSTGPTRRRGHGGSLIGTAEAQLHYILDVLRADVRPRASARVECRPEVHDAYNRRVDAAHERMVWTHPAMDDVLPQLARAGGRDHARGASWTTGT